MDKIVYLWNAKTDNHSPGPLPVTFWAWDVLAWWLMCTVVMQLESDKRFVIPDGEKKFFWGFFPN